VPVELRLSSVNASSSEDVIGVDMGQHHSEWVVRGFCEWFARRRCRRQHFARPFTATASWRQ